MILITGASGHIGRRVSELLAQQNARLRLMSRTPERTFRLAGVEAVPGDFQDPESLARAFADVEKTLIISGKAQPGERARLHNNTFRAAAKAGVRHIVYLSLKGASPDSIYPYCRDHYGSVTGEKALDVRPIPRGIHNREHRFSLEAKSDTKSARRL